MKKEEKVIEVLREEGYKVSEEDVLIGQLIPSFLGSFFTLIPKQVFLAYNSKDFFIIGVTLMKGDPDKNKIKHYSLDEVNIQMKKGLFLYGKLILTHSDGKRENYRAMKFAFGSLASNNFKKALEKFQ
ncbi:hypothetical protein CBG50_05100 [Fusobacterium polymorphum]|uniref:Uncharacterized protein n=1 Tax=Fusobacterium nucleatum subsp. polymorphum TaxID=76857 RepID=A0A1Z3CGN4_FUSNP|nr:hypothetical protein [Fusobacterium polymorphum]ASC02741.1 hypothetical protein CBG50_05100 [Fusobacterium polymorphum]